MCKFFTGFATALLFIFFTLPAPAKTLYVSTDGNDATAKPGNPKLPYSTFQAAINSAGQGDEIEVAGGTYTITPQVVPWYEPLPKKFAPIQIAEKTDLTIRSNPDVAAPVTIYGKGAGDFIGILNSTNVTIKGINFLGTHPSVPVGTNGATRATLLFSMIHLRGYNDGLTFQECNFYKFGDHAISHLWSPKSSQNVRVSDCTFITGGAKNVPGLSIDGSAVSGIGSHWIVENNYIADCQRGLEIECWSPILKHDISLRKNTFIDVYNFGIMLFASCSPAQEEPIFQDIEIAENDLFNVKNGIYISGGDDIRLIRNKISYCSGIGITCTADQNNLSNIQILSNRVDNIITRGIQLYQKSFQIRGTNRIVGNSIQVTGDSGILLNGDNILVEGNNTFYCGYQGHTYGGVEARGGDNLQIHNNTLWTRNPGTMPYGIYLHPGVGRVSLLGNVISNPGVATMVNYAEETDYHLHIDITRIDDEEFQIKAYGFPGFTQVIYASKDLKDWEIVHSALANNTGYVTLETQMDDRQFFRTALLEPSND